jgi:vitamin B12 transporter
MLSRSLAVALLVTLFGAAPPRSASAQTVPYVLDGVVVTAGPTPRALASVAQHVTILDGRELQARGLSSLADALRDLTGVDVVRGGSFGAVTSVFLRGGESDYTLVLIDGVQVNQAGGGFDFASLTTQNIERVEIVRGPSSALYGSDAVAGVIHVITRAGGGPTQGTVRFEAGSYQGPAGGVVDATRWSADLGGGTERARYSVSVGRDAADGILEFNSGHENLMLSGAARFLPDDRTRVGLTLRLEDREYHYPTNGSGALVDRNAFFFEDESIAHLSIARALTDHFEVEALIGLMETDGGTDDAPDDPSDLESFKSLDHFRRASAQIMSHLRVGPTVVTLGGEVEEERQRSFSESLSGFGAFYGRNESERVNQAAFGHVTSERGLVAVSLGGRLEDNERYGSIGTWQVGVAAHLPERPGTRLKFAAGSAIKEPTFAENYATGFAVGNPDLDPEWSLSWEAGVEHDMVPGAARLGLTYFDQRFEEMIQFTFTPPSPTDPNYFNVAAARSRGIEVDASLQVGSVDMGAAWTWLDTEVVDAGLESGAGATFVDGQPLLRRPAHSLIVTAASPLGARARLYTRVGYEGTRDDRDFSTFPATPVEMPGHALWAVGGEWSVRPDLSLSLRGENLLGKSYQEAFGFGAPGRQVYVGVSVGFGGGGAPTP